MFIFVHQLGSPDFPRYIISNTEGCFWDGEVWITEQSQALLYTDYHQICTDVEKLQIQRYLDKPESRFSVPMEITLKSDKPATLEEIKKWMFKNLRIQLALDAQDSPGPSSDSLFLIQVDWNKLWEISHAK